MKAAVGMARWAAWAKAAAGIAFAVLAGCTTVPGRSDQEIVRERAGLRWKAIVAGDLKAAYEMISPGGRSVMTYEGYRSSIKPGFHKGARIQEVQCASPELCEVRLELEYDYLGRTTKTPFSEKWIKQDRQWWILLER